MLKYWATRSPLLGQLPLQPLKMLLFLWCLAEAATATVFASALLKCSRLRSLYTFSSPAVARKCSHSRSLCTCSSPAGTHQGRCRCSLCTCSLPLVLADARTTTVFACDGARRCCCRRSLCNGSLFADSHKSCCPLSLCTGSSPAGAPAPEGLAGRLGCSRRCRQGWGLV